VDYQCNYLQATEGAIDHLHSDVLHSGHHLMGWTEEQVRNITTPQFRGRTSDPEWQMQDTAYGFRYAAITPVGDGQKFVRVSVVALPFHCLLPNVPHMFVPMDDERTWFYDVRCKHDRPVNREASLTERGERVGTDVTPQHYKVRTFETNYGQDRRAMRERKEPWSFSGISWGKPHQDMAMMETMGAIVDRTKEHLGYSDTVISRLRERMLKAIRHFMETGEVAELDPSIPYDRVDGSEATIPAGAPWESVGAFAGEPVPELATPVSARD
jgi:phthalate 4,5-dioxygenase oxygenase subunit